VPDSDHTVLEALARHLGLPLAELVRRKDEDLGQLGLDSHGLMRVLLDIEKALKLPASLELDDAALATPATLQAGVRAVTGPG